MKTGDLIVQYLYQQGKVTLQEIGTFTVTEGLSVSADGDKPVALPPDAVAFEHDGTAKADDGLINYIREQTGKIKPLAAADLDSYVMLHKQFLNIGKPLILDGVGTLQKTQTGIYAFTQAGSVQFRPEEAVRVVTEKQPVNVNFHAEKPEKSTAKRSGLLWILLLILIAGGAFAGWYFLNEQNKLTQNIAAPLPGDSTVTDSLSPPDTLTTTAPVPSVISKPDSVNFYVVIKEYSTRAKAEERLAILKNYGNKVELVTTDSVAYRIRMPFKNPVADTTRVRDSIAKFFNAAGARVEL